MGFLFTPTDRDGWAGVLLVLALVVCWSVFGATNNGLIAAAAIGLCVLAMSARRALRSVSRDVFDDAVGLDSVVS